MQTTEPSGSDDPPGPAGPPRPQQPPASTAPGVGTGAGGPAGGPPPGHAPGPPPDHSPSVPAGEFATVGPTAPAPEGHSEVPPAGAGGYPDVPAPAAELHGSVEMRISKRLLWVGDAAYPLHNIARIHTFTLLPRRQEAVTRFLKRVGLTLPALFFATLMVGLATLTSDSGGTFLTLIWLVGVAALIYYLADLVIVLMAPSHYVLAVETSGPSTAVVTSQNPGHLRQLAQYLANALENPDTEFHVQVETVTFNPQNYYFGDSVNMYGGSGNTGMAKG